MAREMQGFGPIGAVAYSLLFHDGYGVVWNNASLSFEYPVLSNWTSYVLPMTETVGTGIYFGDMPTSLARGTYTYLSKRQLGATPAATDPEISQGSIEWSGSMPVSLAAQLDVPVSSRMVSFQVPSVDSNGRVVLQPTGLDQVIVAGKTLPQAIRYIGSICAGKVSGAGTGLEVFQDFSGTQSVQVFVDSSGNRSNVLYN
jgi:hypothetical protein